MHVGTQQFSTAGEDLEYLARHGVFNKNENNIAFHREYGWDVEELAQKKEKCAGFGINMEMVAIPVAQLNVNGGQVPNYMLGNYEEGDREIELVCNMIRQASEAGIPAVKYFLCEMENQRTESTPPWPRWFDLQHLGPGKGEGHAAEVRRTRDRRDELGPDHLLPGAGGARGDRVQGSHGLPSLRPVAAARLSLRGPRARRFRGVQTLHRDLSQSLPRRQPLPRLHGGEFPGSPQRRAGHHPLLWVRATRSSSATSATSSVDGTSSRKSGPTKGS